MKKLIIICCAMQCIFLAACWHNDGDISFRYKDNHDSYTMDARFSKNQARTAEQYMNDVLGEKNKFSFLNTQTDAVFTLNDGSKFYMKKSPGHILIRVNRDENSDITYHRIKEMCKGIKDAVLE